MQLQLPGFKTPEIEKLCSARDSLVDAHASPVTLANYRWEWKHFSAWCERMGRAALPASSDSLSLYLTDMLTQGKNPLTAARATAAIVYFHRERGFESPRSEEVKRILWGARRSCAKQPRQMQPVTLAQVREVAHTLAADASPKSIRDRAIVVIGFASALRRSNLAALDLADVAFVQQGLAILVRKEKNDRLSRGRVVGVPHGQDPGSCPVRCLEAWLAIRGAEPGPLFTSMISPLGRLAGDTIWVVVKAAIARVTDATRYGPHSLRAGFITEAGLQGVPLLVIARQSGHQSLDVLQRYFRPIDAFRANPCTAIGI